MTAWLTPREAAEHVRAKHPRMILDAIKAGELPAYAYGKAAIRIDAADLEAWMRSRPWEPRKP